MKTIIIIIIYHQDAAKTQRAQPYTQLKLIRQKIKRSSKVKYLSVIIDHTLSINSLNRFMARGPYRDPYCHPSLKLK